MSNKSLAAAFIPLLASSYALYLKTQNFHWNVTGPDFIALHGFLDAQYKELAEAIDTIAERIRALDTFVPATFENFQQLSKISMIHTKAPLQAKAMIEILLTDHHTLCLEMKKLISECAQADDLASQDLIIERLRSHEKTIWMLKSLLVEENPHV